MMMRRPEFLMMRRPCAALRRPENKSRTVPILLLLETICFYPQITAIRNISKGWKFKIFLASARNCLNVY